MSVDDINTDNEMTDNEDWVLQLQQTLETQHLEAQQRLKNLHLNVFYNLSTVIVSFVPHNQLSLCRKVSYSLLQCSDAELRQRVVLQLSKRSLSTKMSLSIEVALFNWSLGTPNGTLAPRSLGLSSRSGQMYKKKLRHIIHNFANVNNDLKQKVLSTKISAFALVRMTSKQMASNKVKKNRAALKEATLKGRLITAKQRHLNRGHLSDRFQCQACNSTECTYKTRPSNLNSKESNNVIVHCMKCPNWWCHYGLFPRKRKRTCSKEGATHYGSTSLSPESGGDEGNKHRCNRGRSGGGGTGNVDSSSSSSSSSIHSSSSSSSSSTGIDTCSSSSSCSDGSNSDTTIDQHLEQGEQKDSQETLSMPGGLVDKLVMNFIEVTGMTDTTLALSYIYYANQNVDEACLTYFSNPAFVPPLLKCG